MGEAMNIIIRATTNRIDTARIMHVAAFDNEEERLIGCCVVKMDLSIPLIHNFAVKKGCRRSGVGTSMMQFIIERCSQLKKIGVCTIVNKENTPAKNLYEKCGLSIAQDRWQEKQWLMTRTFKEAT